jgi:cation diffusion facilitator family transporter
MIKSEVYTIQRRVVIVGVIILLVKFTAYYLTHSNTILSDALESIVNVVAGSFALYSLYISAKPRDIDHPYGHGKVEFVAAGLEGIMIGVAGILIICKGAINLIHPETIEHLGYGLLLIALSGIANYILSRHLTRQAIHYQSVVLEADAQHLMADVYISVAVIAGVVTIWLTHLYVLDNVFGIAAGVYICVSSYRIIRKSLVGIMDEADPAKIELLVALLQQHRRDDWMDIHNLRIIQYGTTWHIDCHVTLPWYYTLAETHEEIERVATIIGEGTAKEIEVFIHPDPCIPDCCSYCLLVSCQQRRQPFVKQIDWTPTNVMQNRKHACAP